MSIIARSSILVTRFDSVPCDIVGVKWKYWMMLSSFLLILIVRTFVFHWWLILPRLFYPESYNGVSKVCPIYYWCKYTEAFHQLDFSNINVSSLSHLLPWSSIFIFFFFFFFALAVLCGLLDLIPWSGIESRPPAVEARRPTCWPAREFP